ncbi:hypothetical protein E3N88_18197 [Mikania micrantha]|uniref:Uncharacterized protein n=1 Tax=Mikania micrantha TaxID=192012 RepID=A0A5N6NU61_9ASTR|nr:hypothetical protein E3N88_18197 [Mikania micrantha]
MWWAGGWAGEHLVSNPRRSERPLIVQVRFSTRSVRFTLKRPSYTFGSPRLLLVSIGKPWNRIPHYSRGCRVDIRWNRIVSELRIGLQSGIRALALDSTRFPTTEAPSSNQIHFSQSSSSFSSQKEHHQPVTSLKTENFDKVTVEIAKEHMGLLSTLTQMIWRG